ncbi:hypothetical protein A2810_00590 [candidate division Kazan bacterium RIFCSPHIGHO2_01_FULL_49_10]|uniref:Uncharacterized protein n=1 Tax=candidate division Kazan bacterium RIFCSPLOWO2_01_FULL_48_13 TaxID=1798539 RepID=A0A1F4PMY8_UNCK3|nr:MAG: hypothetical protein A2810_00590 [candidate division Kazan bacterium RIFCSPHIGHO2_01_FULL_49_10]OGB85047.1 MAG: hypothetical protein A2994_00320 [candidate division Kazan bacterium RIFCSPLOWO2_01_FULL_48_13]
MGIVVVWIIYFILLLLSLIYAGVIVYHILKYRYDDLPREQAQYAGRALSIYLGLGGLTLLLSIVVALFMILF